MPPRSRPKTQPDAAHVAGTASAGRAATTGGGARPQGQVSLLRGINVGGHNQIAMPRLREIYVSLGLDSVTTHINSGNVIVSTDREPDALARDVEAAIRRELGLEIRALGRTHADLGRILAEDPFPDAHPSRHIVAFLSGPPTDEAMERLRARATDEDRVEAVGRELHLLYGAGMAGSKMSAALIERPGLVATARNLRTVTRLHELTAPQG